MTPSEKSPGFLSGTVALIGRTNAGKSTFLNTILEAKVSIVSDKAQTTRRQILGIKTSEKGQIVFFDSPGIHRPHHKLNERMMKDVHASLGDTDLILYFVDIGLHRDDPFIRTMLQPLGKPVFLVINKIDKFSKSKILEFINFQKDKYPWAEIVPISALSGDNTDYLLDLVFKYLPEGPPFYPQEELTVQSERYYSAEIVREKLLNETEDEIPFTTTVKTEEIQKKENVVVVRADIYVESKSQKKIVIGSQGSRLRKIGEAARLELEEYFSQKVYLELFVKVMPNWRNSPQLIGDMLV